MSTPIRSLQDANKVLGDVKLYAESILMGQSECGFAASALQQAMLDAMRVAEFCADMLRGRPDAIDAPGHCQFSKAERYVTALSKAVRRHPDTERDGKAFAEKCAEEVAKAYRNVIGLRISA